MFDFWAYDMGNFFQRQKSYKTQQNNMASLTEQLSKPKEQPTNEGNIDQESLPPMYPIPPPGWLSSEYAESHKTERCGVAMQEDARYGKHLVATRDFAVGETVVEDTAMLQVYWDTDHFLHSPIHGLLAKMKAQYGEMSLEQGYVQIVATFLQHSLQETRASGAQIWDLLSFATPILLKEDEKALREVSRAIHENIPSAFEDVLTEAEVYQLLRAFDTNNLACRTGGKEHSCVYPFARLAEHNCRANCVFSFLDHPEDEWNSRVQYHAIEPIHAGDHISISYIPGYKCTKDRRALLTKQYGFLCTCPSCVTEPDLSRGFKCWLCEENKGVISPLGSGDKDEDWTCMQCGVMCEHERITEFLEHEKKLRVVKADKWKGLSQLMGDDLMHYTHYLSFRKLDFWAQKAWEMKDGETTANMVEALLKCAERVFQKGDPVIAQYHEFIAQVRHGMGEAYTARDHFQRAYKIREAIGQKHTYWAKKTYYMAYDKPLAELMDGK